MVEETYYAFAQQHLRPTLMQRDTGRTFAWDAWRSLAQTGLFGLALPQALGGSGQSLRSAAAAWRGLGQGSLDMAFCTSAIAQTIAVELLGRLGANTPHHAALAGFIRGDLLAAVSNAEAGAGTDVRAIRSRLDVSADGSGLAHVHKPGATNLPGADLVFASVWCHGLHPSPSLEVIVLDGAEVTQRDHAPCVAGFRTGLTGGVDTPEAGTRFAHAASRIVGGRKAGFQVLRHCFNLERLYIGCLVAGVLAGARQEALQALQGKVSMGQPLLQHQFVQAKIIQIVAAERHLQGLIDSIVLASDDTPGLAKSTQLLALLKLAVIETAGPALRACFELFGFVGFTEQHFAQKLVRDHMALCFLGGTAEQQKIVLFSELLQENSQDATQSQSTCSAQQRRRVSVASLQR